MREPFDDKKVENSSVAGSQVLDRSYDLIIGNPVQRILGVRRNLYDPIVKVRGELVFVVFTKMVDSRVYHYFSQPTFEGTYHIRISRLIPVNLLKNL